MITNYLAKNMDVGLPVIYDGDHNTLIYYDRMIDYPAGGLIAEYARLTPTEIKGVIMECGHLADEPTDDNIAAFVDEFQTKMAEHFLPVIAMMATLEIFNTILEWLGAEQDGRGDEYLKALKDVTSCEEINTYIFGGTGFSEVGKSTVGQMALSSYASYAMNYVNTKYTFDSVIEWANSNGEAENTGIELLTKLYSEMTEMQHIDFRIINIEDGFHSLYSIKSSMSLLTFEMAHWLSKDVNFIKCRNCGHYFIPDGRSDQIYCTYPSPQNGERTCREIGAQVTRLNKEKNDVVTREYRKVYMRYKMLTKRHPENRDARKTFDKLTDGMRQWRKDLASGIGTADQFLEWLKEF